MRKAVIVGYARSAFHFANKGLLTRVRPDEMVSSVVRGLVEQLNLEPEDIEDLILGCAFPEGEQGLNMARLVVLMAGLPKTVSGVTVNRFCGSSMQSIHMAAGAIALGAGDLYVCGGVESMSRVPIMGFNPMPSPELMKMMPEAYIGMGDTAENVASKFKISRQAQEQFAVTSHAKASAAQLEGRLKDEIIPVAGIDQDGCIRVGTTPGDLASLKPAFDENGSVTAGTSSPLTDGASVVIVCSEEYAERQKLAPLGGIKSVAVAGCLPELMGMGPVHASQKALERAGLSIEDIDVFELNEAFASQAIACIDQLGIDPAKVNLDGGAIALGHPLGATGARITGKAAAVLKRQGGKYALATQCIGGGQGIATIVEAI